VTSASDGKSNSLVGILLRFLVNEPREFAEECLRMLRHPFTFFDGRNAADPAVLYGALDFFVFSCVAQGVLWFISMLPELPGSEFVPEGYRTATLFAELFLSGLIWHLLLRAGGRHRAVALRGTIAVVLYSSGFGAVLIVPYFVMIRVLGTSAARLLGEDPGPSLVLLFLLLLMPFLIFFVCLRARWMAACHRVRRITAFWTMMAADGSWALLREYVVVPWILLPAFRVSVELYKRIVLRLLAS
jgi:hypothetical protein